MRESMWRFVLGLAIGLAIGAMLPVLEAGISGGGGGGAGTWTDIASDTLSPDFTTTSTTFVSVTNLSATGTATANERWLVEWRLIWRGGVNGIGVSQLRVDGASVWEPSTQEDATQELKSSDYVHISAALSAGARVIDVQGLTTASTAAWFSDITANATLDRCEIQVYALR